MLLCFCSRQGILQVHGFLFLLECSHFLVHRPLLCSVWSFEHCITFVFHSIDQESLFATHLDIIGAPSLASVSNNRCQTKYQILLDHPSLNRAKGWWQPFICNVAGCTATAEWMIAMFNCLYSDIKHSTFKKCSYTTLRCVECLAYK